jgi:RNA polymerase sigma-70 factor, ECF subfamily
LASAGVLLILGGEVCVVAALKSSSADLKLDHIWGELIRGIAQGDQTALAEFYDRTSPYVFGLVSRIVVDRVAAEEVMVDVYHSVWQQASRYEAARAAPLSWVLMIARNRALDWRRSHMPQAQDPGKPLRKTTPSPDASTVPIEISAVAERRRAVESALVSLSPEQREAIELAFFSELGLSEIAARMGKPKDTVKKQIRQGMLKLRGLLQPDL